MDVREKQSSEKRLIDANAMRDDWMENGENEYVYDTNAVLDSIDSQLTVIENPLSGKLRGVTYEDGKIIDVHIRDTDDVVKVFVPVRHGRWIRINKLCGEYECSVCHGADSNCSGYYGTHIVTEQNYCPFCGAKMDGGAD